MDFTEKTLTAEQIFEGRVITLHQDTVQLPNGSKATREVIEHPGGVGVVALDEEENLFLVTQFRYPYREMLMEIPAGKLTRGEDPLEAGKRELKEETGVSAQEYISLGKLYPSPGYCAEIIHMYLARNLSYGEQCPDEDEFLNVVKMPLKQVVDKVMSGEITDSKTQAAVLKAWFLLHGEK